MIAVVAGLLILLFIYRISKERGGSQTGYVDKEPEGRFIGLGIGIGIAIFMPIGIVFGILIDNIALGISIGPALGVGAGVAIGAGLEQRNKKNNNLAIGSNLTAVRRSILIGSLLVALGIILLVTLIMYK
jgi:hypothetical protein